MAMANDANPADRVAQVKTANFRVFSGVLREKPPDSGTLPGRFSHAKGTALRSELAWPVFTSAASGATP